MRPSKRSSDVSRQYERSVERTWNTSTLAWSTSRDLMSTNGLTVKRESSSSLMSRGSSTPDASAPGRLGPRTTPVRTATAASAPPIVSNERCPD
jgi:hypothetical protein